MQMYVPPTWTCAPAPRATSAIAPATAAQIGSAKLTWPTMPSPKNVSARWRVRSMNWSGKTRSVGAYSSFIEPTALAERIVSTPRSLKPKRFAR